MENHIVAGDVELQVAKIGGADQEREERKMPKWQDIWFGEYVVYLGKGSRDDAVDLSEKNWVGKTFHYTIRLPVTILLRLTIPPPAEKAWDRRFAAVSPVGATLFLFVFYNGSSSALPISPSIAWTKLLFNTIPYIFLFLGIAVLLGFIIKWKTQLTRAPSYLYVFTLAALVMSFHWAWACSSFIVDCLDLLGFVMRTPAVYLGITFLALGNSANDVIMSVAVAQGGFIIMSIANVFSSPLFNILIGLGVSFIALMIRDGKSVVKLSMHGFSCVLPIVALFCAVVLLIVIMFVAWYNRFVLGKRLAKGLILAYAGFIAIATLLTFA